jgi:hypothetical protein
VAIYLLKGAILVFAFLFGLQLFSLFLKSLLVLLGAGDEIRDMTQGISHAKGNRTGKKGGAS